MATHPAPQQSSQEMGERFDDLPASAKPGVLFVMGMEGRLTSWNRGCEELFGYEAGEIVGKHFSEFFTAEDLALGRPAAEIRSAHSKTFAANDCWQIRKDGSRFWCQVTVTSLQDEKGRVQSFARIVRALDSPEAIVGPQNPVAGSAG